jgi:membrane protein DedA with SNARE-associated domain/rhodanese-related sulfurtransferase
MTQTQQFLIAHGAPIVFGAVFVEQIGLPVPAFPWLLGVGALCAGGKFSIGIALLVSLIACVLADGIWFYLGRYKGSKVLGLLCRMSLEPDSCVRRTENMFSKYGWRGLLVAKFVPGLSTVAPPLAGMSHLSATVFFAADGAGAILYAGTFIAAGYFFGDQLEQVGHAISSIGSGALYLVVGLAAAYILVKYWQRKRLLDALRMARITVEELGRMLDEGQSVVILDLRSREEFAAHAGINGAIHLTVDDIQQGRIDLPRGGEVIVYCSCPNEATAARAALLLRRHGIPNARPLLGGIDAWNERMSKMEV